jgi:hypothetical protein
MVRRYNLAKVEGDGMASLCEFGVYARLNCSLCEFREMAPMRDALGGFIYAAS